MCDITDKEWEQKYLPFYQNLNIYLINYIIPDVIAFYIANSYSRKCLCNSSLTCHINSAKDIFNIQCENNKLIPKLKNLLKVKYNLIVINNNPLRLKNYL